MSDIEISAASLGETFREVISHMKGSIPVWEDFLSRGLKFHKQLDQITLSLNSFLEGLGKVSDVACRANGGTNDVGAGLTNLIMWHRRQELKLKELSVALLTKMLAPLQTKIDQWKKTTALMDREHEREVQKAVKDIKEATKLAAKTHKSLEAKIKKDKNEKAAILRHQLDRQKAEKEFLIHDAEEREKQHLNNAMLEERKWYCGFVAAYSKSLEIESSMYTDVERLNASLQDLGAAITQPTELPDIAKEFVENWKIPLSGNKQHVHIPHGSTVSLNSIHSHTSHTSQDSVTITAPVHQPGNVLSNSIQSGSTSNIRAQTTMSGTPPFMPGAPPPPPGLPPSSIPGAPPIFGCSPVSSQSPQFPPLPPGPPPASAFCGQADVNYSPPQPHYPPPPSGLPPSSMAYGQLPPPPPPNFPPPADMGSGMVNRPLPPVPMSECNVDPGYYPRTSIVSMSSSEMSLASHQSSESSRSLSPPIGPSYSPGQTRAHLAAVREVDPASSLQAALSHKLMQRSQTIDKDPPGPLHRAMTMGGTNATKTCPPVAYRPPRGPQPQRGPVRSNSVSTHYNHAAGPPHHVLEPDLSQASSDSDHDEESAFAKALRQKKLRKANSFDTPAAPRMY